MPKMSEEKLFHSQVALTAESLRRAALSDEVLVIAVRQMSDKKRGKPYRSTAMAYDVGKDLEDNHLISALQLLTDILVSSAYSVFEDAPEGVDVEEAIHKAIGAAIEHHRESTESGVRVENVKTYSREDLLG